MCLLSVWPTVWRLRGPRRGQRAARAPDLFLLFQGWYIVTYALGIYHLNLFIAFLSPKVDPSLMEDSGRCRPRAAQGRSVLWKPEPL